VDSDAAIKLTTRAFAELKANPKIGRAEAFPVSMKELIETRSLAEARNVGAVRGGRRRRALAETPHRLTPRRTRRRAPRARSLPRQRRQLWWDRASNNVTKKRGPIVGCIIDRR
jgi:hypothetical protein